MSATLPLPPSLRPNWLGFAAEWWPVLLGLAVLFLPTYADLNRTLWNAEENAHGPIALLVVLWLFWFKRHALLAEPQQVKPVAGGMLLGFGLLLYALGRSQEILLFEIGSEMLILGGALLMLRGVPAVRTLWFPLFFLIFLIPVPGFIVDTLTGPLKHYISILVEQAIYAAGYPIARNGVTLSIGPYQLLVADACSGLNSMFSLSAMGLLYLYLMQHQHGAHPDLGREHLADCLLRQCDARHHSECWLQAIAFWRTGFLACRHSAVCHCVAAAVSLDGLLGLVRLIARSSASVMSRLPLFRMTFHESR